MSISLENRQHAELYAAEYKLPLWLVLAVIETESSGSPWAMRFEPAFLARYIPPRVTTYGASLDTERMARATSYGLMQVMGQVARELNFTQPFLTALCHPEIGIKYGCKHLAALCTRYFDAHGWDGVAAAYNAGSPRKGAGGQYVNQTYVNKIMAHRAD